MQVKRSGEAVSADTKKLRKLLSNMSGMNEAAGSEVYEILERIERRSATVETTLVSLIAAEKRWIASGPSTEEDHADNQALIGALAEAEKTLKDL